MVFLFICVIPAGPGATFWNLRASNAPPIDDPSDGQPGDPSAPSPPPGSSDGFVEGGCCNCTLLRRNAASCAKAEADQLAPPLRAAPGWKRTQHCRAPPAPNTALLRSHSPFESAIFCTSYAGCSRVEEGTALQRPNSLLHWPVALKTSPFSFANIPQAARALKRTPPCRAPAWLRGPLPRFATATRQAQPQQNICFQQNRGPSTHCRSPIHPPIHLPTHLPSHLPPGPPPTGVPPPHRVWRRHLRGLHLPLLSEAAGSNLESRGAAGSADDCAHQLPLAAAAAQVRLWLV